MLYQELLNYDTDASEHLDIFGDGYLLRENPVYRRIKRSALALGATFRPATTDYLLLPFNQLERIVTTKEIPYVPHGRLMREIEARRPGVFGPEDMPLPESYHLHEAAHVIADACAPAAGDAPEDRILRAIACESFANTTDALASSYAETPVHRVLLKMNCYMAPRDADVALMRRLREALGEGAVVRLLLQSYLHANFLRAEVPQEEIEAIVGTGDAIPPAKKLMKDAVTLTKIGQRLDPLFRVQTTQNFLRMAGFDGEVYDLLDFDFRARLTRGEFASAVDTMVAALSTP